MGKQDYLPLSFSSLKAFSRSPLAFLDYKLGRKVTTPAMRFGTLVHRAILEPEKYEASVAITEHRRGTKAYKEFVEQNEGKDILKTKEAMDIRLIANRVLDHTYAGTMIKQCQHYELPFEIEQCGVPHRGIIDGLGSWFVLDLKTTSDVSHDALSRTIWSAKYYMQAAIYERAAHLMGYDPESYFIIAVESAAPHHVQVVELEPQYVARGHMEWERLLSEWKEWDGKSRHNLDEEDEAGWQMDAPPWVPHMDLGL